MQELDDISMSCESRDDRVYSLSTHSIPRVLDLLSLATQVSEDVCADILGLERYAMGILEAPPSVLQRLCASQKA